MAPIFSSLSSGGGGRGRGFGYGRNVAVAARDPLRFVTSGDINPANLVATDGTPAGGFWVAGDIVEATYSGAQRSMNYASYAGPVTIHVIGGGGGTEGDRSGWCSNSGGGGGGGAVATLSSPSNGTFYVGNGGSAGTNGGENPGSAGTGEKTWYGSSNTHFGNGGTKGSWCQPTSTRGQGGTWGSNYAGATGSNGGNGGGAVYGGNSGGNEQGSSSAWGGGGGGGSDDSDEPTGVNRAGGQCHTSWSDPTGAKYAGSGAGRQNSPLNQRTRVVGSNGFGGQIPMPNRGGGAGGVAHENESPAPTNIPGVQGGSGVVIFRFG